MRPRYLTSLQIASANHLSGIISKHSKNRENSNRLSQHENWWQLSFGITRIFFWWIVCQNSVQSVQIIIVRLKEKYGESFKKEGEECFLEELCFFTTISTQIAAKTQEFLEQYRWKILDNLPYNPDIVSNSHHLFTKLKDFLGSKHFGIDELKNAVNT